MVADGLFNGSRSKIGQVARPEAGISAAGRYAYLMPLLMACPTEPLGEDADDAVGAFFEADEGFHQMKMLLATATSAR